MVTVYQTAKIKDLPALAKAHQYVLKARLSLQSRRRAIRKRGGEFELDWLIDLFTRLEEDLEGLMDRTYREHILYLDLKHIKGLGTELGAKLVGFIEGVEDGEGRTGIACFDTLSRFWTFCGYGLPTKKTAGEKLHYNPELKAHCFKIATNFALARNKFYQKVYLPRKDAEVAKFDAVVSAKKGKVKTLPPGVTTSLHIHQRAVRVEIKAFLGCLYYRWRELLGLPRRVTYAEEKLGHTTHYKLEDFWD